MLNDYAMFSSDGDETSSYAETTDDEDAVFLQLSSAEDFEAGSDGGKLVTINQYAQDVVDFSSQYGSDTSISYTAYNVTGKPSKYPDYGDFPETFAFRTYGPWWKQAPSACGEFGSRNGQDLPVVDDYILVRFEEPVIPEQIKIFETYNPGAIVRIWAYTQAEQWFLLWDGTCREDLPQVKRNEARIFCPPLNTTPSPTRFIRFEFNHAELEYSTQLDAILMVGQKFVPNVVPTKKQRFSATVTVNREVIQQYEQPSSSQSSSRSSTPTDGQIREFTLDQMPFDVLFNILAHLDLQSLYRCGQVCRTFRQIVAVDSLLYTELNLKPYWNCATSALLQSLKKRCAFTKKLNLSWCGLFNKITATDFKDFIAKCGSHLTHLRLDSCKFMTTGNCLESIGRFCSDNLTELSLQNYHPQTRDFSGLYNFTKLERLNLNRTSIDTQSLLIVLARNENLRHLNLAFCTLDVSMDDVALQISKFNRKLISLDMWKSHSLTSIGLEALTNCVQLEEVDFGWCLREEPSPGEAIRALARSCPRLKKLFLAAIRGLTDRDLDVISANCVNLEQLDLMGSMGISTDMCHRLLTRCRKLRLLDLSFCDNLDNVQICLLRECFDVAIKRSFIDFGPPRSEF